MSRARGFTLVEVMIVLIIISVLAATAWPGYAAYMTRTRRMEGKVALIEAMGLEEQHRAQHHTYLAWSRAEPVEGVPWWSGSGAAASAYEISADACPDSELRDCVQVTARPGTANVDVRFRDPDCGTLFLRSTGEQGASGLSTRCWP